MIFSIPFRLPKYDKFYNFLYLAMIIVDLAAIAFLVADYSAVNNLIFILLLISIKLFLLIFYNLHILDNLKHNRIIFSFFTYFVFSLAYITISLFAIFVIV